MEDGKCFLWFMLCDLLCPHLKRGLQDSGATVKLLVKILILFFVFLIGPFG